MALPTRDQLYDETDRRYKAAHPDAPDRIDPDDPAHNGWERTWLEIRDSVLYEWTDEIFYQYFPSAGRLDPGNPDDELLIRYWNDIKDQICNGQPGEWSWDSGPPPAQQRSIWVDQVIRSVAQGGFEVTFSDTVDEGEAIGVLWPNGKPSSAEVRMTSAHQAHVTLDMAAVQQMPDEVARLFSEAGILTAD